MQSPTIMALQCDELIHTCYLENTTSLNLSNFDLKETPRSMTICTNLEKLDLSGNYLSNVTILPRNLLEIDISDNTIRANIDFTIFSAPLTKIVINNNKLFSLDGMLFPKTLTCLDASMNNIKNVYNLELLTKLKTLDLSNNILSCSIKFPSSVENIDVSNNKLRTLEIHNTQCQRLTAINNTIQEVLLTSTLKHVNLSNNVLSNLLNITKSIVYLDLSDNPMCELDVSHTNCVVLIIDGCSFVKLDPLPKTLIHLRCGNNNLTYLPILHEGLKILEANNNFLKTVNIPSTLEIAKLDNNNIVTPIKGLDKVKNHSMVHNYPEDYEVMDIDANSDNSDIQSYMCDRDDHEDFFNRDMINSEYSNNQEFLHIREDYFGNENDDDNVREIHNNEEDINDYMNLNSNYPSFGHRYNLRSRDREIEEMRNRELQWNHSLRQIRERELRWHHNIQNHFMRTMTPPNRTRIHINKETIELDF